MDLKDAQVCKSYPVYENRMFVVPANDASKTVARIQTAYSIH